MPKKTGARRPPNKPVMGQPIRFVGGTYVGRVGWIDIANKTRSSGKLCVIVDVDEHDAGMLAFAATVERANVRWVHAQATSWADSAIQQHPKLEAKMIAMAKHFAACDMEGNEESVLALLKNEFKYYCGLQNSLASPKWFKVKHGG